MRITPGTEIAVGVAVFAVLVAAAASIFDKSEAVATDRYRVEARYTRVDGVTVGSQVMAAGIPVGQVVGMRLDEDNFAVVTMEIDEAIELDSDASANIVSESIFGSKYIRLDIGGGEFVIGAGERIFWAESAMIVEDILKQVVAMGDARVARQKATGE